MIERFKNRKLFTQKLINFIVFVFFLLVGEVILYLFTCDKFLPTLFFLDLLLMCLIGSIIFLFKNLLFDMIYLSIMFTFITFIYCLNYNYDCIFGNYFRLDTISGVNVFEILKAYGNILSVGAIIFYSLLIVLFFFLILFFNIRYRNRNKDNIINTKKGFIKSISFLVVSLCLYSISLASCSLYEKHIGNDAIDEVSLSTKYFTKKFGILTYYVKEIESKIFKTSNLSKEDVLKYFNDYEYIEDEFTGLLKGYNVFTIMIETGSRAMVNEYTTPTLYKLLNDGVNFKNNYSKNQTINAEYYGFLGNVTTNYLDYSIDYKLPFSLPNILSDYDSIYYQDIGPHSDTYKQMQFMDKTGFKKLYYHDHLLPDTPEWSYSNKCWDLDSDVFKSINNDIKGYSKPFYAHYSTMVMHGDYNYTPSREKLFKSLKEKYEDKLKSLIKENKWSNPLKNSENEEGFYNYTLATMDFDAGLESFINNLKSLNLLDNTLIVLYGDHDIYCTSGATPISWAIKNKNNADEIEIYDTVFGLYNQKLNNYFYSKYNTHDYDKFISPSCIVPTILDLLGVRYNPKYYQSKSAFDKTYENEIMYSYNLSCFMNKNYLATSTSGIDKVFDDNNTKDMFIEKCRKYFEQQKYIDQIYNKNIFK